MFESFITQLMNIPKGTFYFFIFIKLFRFGYIDFKHPESVKKAIELNNKTVEGRKIFVVILLCKKKNTFTVIRIMKLERQKKATN